MKKIVLLSLVFGLLSGSAYATYYETFSPNCADAAMLADLDRATATHRAVITKTSCEYAAPRPAPRVMPTRYVAAKRYVNRVQRVYQPVVVYRPVMTVVSVAETCTCCNCGCGC